MCISAGGESASSGESHHRATPTALSSRRLRDRRFPFASPPYDIHIRDTVRAAARRECRNIREIRVHPQMPSSPSLQIRYRAHERPLDDKVDKLMTQITTGRCKSRYYSLAVISARAVCSIKARYARQQINQRRRCGGLSWKLRSARAKLERT